MRYSSDCDSEFSIGDSKEVEGRILSCFLSIPSMDDQDEKALEKLCISIGQLNPNHRHFLFPIIRHLLGINASWYSPIARSLLQPLETKDSLPDKVVSMIFAFLCDELFQENVYSQECESTFVELLQQGETNERILDCWLHLLRQAIQTSTPTVNHLYSLFLQQLDHLPLPSRLSYLLTKRYSFPFLQWFSNRTQFIQHPNECLCICVLYSYLCDQAKSDSVLGVTRVGISSASPLLLLHHSLSTLCALMDSCMDVLSHSFLGTFLTVVFHGEADNELRACFIQLASSFFQHCPDQSLCQTVSNSLISLAIESQSSWRLEVMSEMLTSGQLHSDFSEELFLRLLQSEHLVCLANRSSYSHNLFSYLFQPIHCNPHSLSFLTK